jgi:hypothetical protein
MSEKKKLYYCPECSHVYFNLPDKGICVICRNEITANEFVKENDLLKCETCHSLYNPTAPDELIPNPSLNEKFLCACKNNCPTESVLQVQQESKGFVGNIIIAAPFQCTNCKAIMFRGFEERHKECTVCKSRFLIPIEFDSEVEKIFYKCANPNHGIRLKLRDILVHNNNIVTGRFGPIKKKEASLFAQYNQKKAEINAQSDGFLGKNFQNKQRALQNLDLWAKNERFKLYDMSPLPARCALYKEDPKNPKELIKTDGCDAIVELNIRRVVDTDTKSTQIKRKPTSTPAPASSTAPAPTVSTSSTIPNSPVVSPTLPINTEQTPPIVSPELGPIPEVMSSAITTPTSESESHPLASNSTDDQINLTDQVEMSETIADSPLTTMILRPSPIVEEVVTKIVKPFNNLELPSDKFIGKIVLNSINEKGGYHITPLNYGLISIALNKSARQIRFGRQTLLQAYWSNPEFFAKQPYLFDNITPITPQSAQFKIEWRDDGFYIIPEMNAFNKITRKTQTGEIEVISQPTILNPTDSIEILTYYALDKQTIDIPHQFLFQISFQIPNNIKTLVGVP